MSKLTPAHHREIDIPKREIRDGYGGVRAFGNSPIRWIIVAAASTQLRPGEKPPAENYIRVIVAPARVAP